ncbi:hypothetical protein P153DRAFT_19774 [Dothidotthia symphoricarpi CBS 119687]|uniref:Uncharacterized protein n=1 Tax=Dothidotthia symphoricarpi CBS 119687 TaxID=1392245 RepID=A0A6A6AEK3_9PLEO|nr:uncharacterized protein P153DRAFT_19774 [Dothidotthia symphoricarpi CBS 119687]KAF2129438.1 hypothetical protein P153DRAFT_19774 [Dothidotthia symphoricarpi CBS 119687]
MSSWKFLADTSEAETVELTPFLNGRKFFAVDDSGSTGGAVLKRERDFVYAFHNNYANPADVTSLWGFDCDNPTDLIHTIEWKSNHGGTTPSEILQNPTALDAIKSSDVWYLLTDGEVYDGEVNRLAEQADEFGILGVPLVFLIVSHCGLPPSQTDISVGISFFASSQDTLILFKETNTGKMYVIAGKGCFTPLSAGVQNLDSWKNMPVFQDEAELFAHCKQLDIQVTKAESRKEKAKGISLGAEWEKRQGGAALIDLELLLKAGFLSDQDVMDILEDEAFNTLAVACKTRRQIPELRSLILSQKVEQASPQLEDVSGAATIIASMGQETITEEERRALQSQLREAHAANRKHYQETIAEFASSPTAQKLKKRNLLVDVALRNLASVEAATFSADILSRKSNRAKRAEVVSADAAIEITKLDFEAPSYKGFCLVCCGDEEVMSISFKKADPDKAEDNTTDFALNFPLAAGASAKNVGLVSSQNICFQCALLGPSGMSIYKEPLAAVIPTVQYKGDNKKYINDQLYLALTARLATGAAGIAQLVMSILEEILTTKPWAGAGLEQSTSSTDEQHEAAQRRDMFSWFLEQLIQNTRTRETFSETGNWVKYPQALLWAATDFEKKGLASFAVTYPVAGFDRLLSLGKRTGAFPDDVLSRLRSAKAVYSVAAKYLADLQVALQNPTVDTDDFKGSWKQKYLEFMYNDFNGPLVPKYQGSNTLLTDTEVFFSRFSSYLGRADAGLTHTKQGEVMRKIQVILFWLIFKQRGHCTAQTFFTQISQTEQLASAILDPILSVPEAESREILLSIFATQKSELINADAAAIHDTMVPFENPFGASVLHCGAGGCSHKFCDITDIQEVTQERIDATRKARTKHLIEVFGVRNRFENSGTGLPEPTLAGKPPSSIHTNAHISIASEWAAQSQEKRRAILAEGTERKAFVVGVRQRLCAQGRGDVYRADIDRDTRELLPSFFAVLAVALRVEGKNDSDISIYTHDFEKNNNVEGKMRWELAARDI